MKNTELKKLLRKIFIEEDPVRIYFPDSDNIDEYDGEIDMVIAILPSVRNKEDLLNSIYEIFKTSFGEIEATKTNERYKPIAEKIWNIIKEKKEKTNEE